MLSPLASPAEKSDPPKRKRGWRWLLQFRLRTILILTTVVAIWLGWWLHSARQQREAVAELRKVGADVFYDFHGYDPKEPPYWPAWLVNWLGVDCFANVSNVEVGELGELGNGERTVTDADLQHVKSFKSLQGLVLVKTHVTDAGLEHLKDLTSLQYLALDRTHITDAGLEHLRDLTSLQGLVLMHTRLSDAGLEHLKSLTSLQILMLVDTQISDAGLEHLKSLTSLQELYLYNTQVADAGLARLQESLPDCHIEQLSMAQPRD